MTRRGRCRSLVTTLLIARLIALLIAEQSATVKIDGNHVLTLSRFAVNRSLVPHRCAAVDITHRRNCTGRGIIPCLSQRLLPR